MELILSLSGPGPLKFGHGASDVSRPSGSDERGGCRGCDYLECCVVIRILLLWVNNIIVLIISRNMDVY